MFIFKMKADVNFSVKIQNKRKLSNFWDRKQKTYKHFQNVKEEYNGI